MIDYQYHVMARVRLRRKKILIKNKKVVLYTKFDIVYFIIRMRQVSETMRQSNTSRYDVSKLLTSRRQKTR